MSSLRSKSLAPVGQILKQLTNASSGRKQRLIDQVARWFSNEDNESSQTEPENEPLKVPRRKPKPPPSSSTYTRPQTALDNYNTFREQKLSEESSADDHEQILFDGRRNPPITYDTKKKLPPRGSPVDTGPTFMRGIVNRTGEDIPRKSSKKVHTITSKSSIVGQGNRTSFKQSVDADLNTTARFMSKLLMKKTSIDVFNDGKTTEICHPSKSVVENVLKHLYKVRSRSEVEEGSSPKKQANGVKTYAVRSANTPYKVTKAGSKTKEPFRAAPNTRTPSPEQADPKSKTRSKTNISFRESKGISRRQILREAKSRTILKHSRKTRELRKESKTPSVLDDTARVIESPKSYIPNCTIPHKIQVLKRRTEEDKNLKQQNNIREFEKKKSYPTPSYSDYLKHIATTSPPSSTLKRTLPKQDKYLQPNEKFFQEKSKYGSTKEIDKVIDSVKRPLPNLRQT